MSWSGLWDTARLVGVAAQGVEQGAQPPPMGAGGITHGAVLRESVEGAAMFFAGPDGQVAWTNRAGQRVLGDNRSLAAALHLEQVPVAPAAVRVTWTGNAGVRVTGLLTLEPLHGGTVGVISEVAAATGQATTIAAGRAMGATPRAPQRRLAARALAVALERDQLQVCYQPIVELASGSIVAAEAMIRWRHPRLGGLGHDAVMSLGKDGGLDVTLGRWLLEEAIHQATGWAADPSLPPALNLHVTVAATQLASAELAERAAAMLAAAPLPPQALCIQAPERALTAAPDLPAAHDGVRRLHDHGIRVGLTQFGIGGSSLVQLQHDPVDVVRLDPSLVDGIATDSADSAMVATVLSVSEMLGMDVVAAGVRDTDQVSALRNLGCRYAQGPHLGGPLEPSAFVAAARSAWAQPPQEGPIRTSTAAGTSPSRR